MSIVIMIFISVLAGWSVNVIADALPTRRSLSETWHLPLRCLPLPQLYRNLGSHAAVSGDEMTPLRLRRYRLIFVAAIILGLLALVQTADWLVMAILAIQAWFFLAIAIIDLEHRLVLNRMLLVGVPFVLLGNLMIGSPNLTSTLLGGVAGFGFFLFLALLAPGAMGMGDVKLAGFIGLITGLSGVMMALFLGILAGGIAGVIVLAKNRFRRGNTLAYAPYLVLGIWVFLFEILDKMYSFVALVYS